MNPIHPSFRARLLAAVACICVLLPVVAADAQTAPPEAPLPPPASAPRSRLTVTPAEFEQWLAGLPPSDATAITEEPDDSAPSLVTPPPPPPRLVTPPPPPPTLVAPPAPAAIAPVPTPGVPAVTPAPGATQPPATTASPPPEPALTAPPAPQVATLPPDSPVTTAPPPAPEGLPRPAAVKILYPEGVMEVPEAAKPDLDEMAAWLRQNPSVRVQIVGYASESTTTGSPARRTSLFRTLAVRKYLVDNGVLSTRMDVRALGDKTEELPLDRVEISLPPL